MSILYSISVTIVKGRTELLINKQIAIYYYMYKRTGYMEKKVSL